MNYKNRIYDTVTAYMAKLSEFDTLERELEAQERSETISRVHAAERREEWEQRRKSAYENTINEIEHIRRSHTEAVDKWNELSGDKLSADAELLKMDISMDQRQFQALCSKHKDNSLMLQLLCDYADRHPDEPLRFLPDEGQLHRTGRCGRGGAGSVIVKSLPHRGKVAELSEAG